MALNIINPATFNLADALDQPGMASGWVAGDVCLGSLVVIQKGCLE